MEGRGVGGRYRYWEGMEPGPLEGALESEPCRLEGGGCVRSLSSDLKGMRC